MLRGYRKQDGKKGVCSSICFWHTLIPAFLRSSRVGRTSCCDMEDRATMIHSTNTDSLHTHPHPSLIHAPSLTHTPSPLPHPHSQPHL